MATYTEPRVGSDVLKDFFNHELSAEQVLIKAGQILPCGALIALDATNKGIEADITAATPATIYGVLLRPVNTTSPTNADANALVVARVAVLASKGIVYKTGATAPQIVAANAQLAAKQIVIRTSI